MDRLTDRLIDRLVVVIISWNTVDLTRDCLVSTYEELARLDIESEVWVVDNASEDDSVAMIREQFPKVTLIENNENVGFARANNQVLHKADGSMYLLLNSDTIVRPGGIGKLVEYLQAQPDIAAVGPRLILRDDSIQKSIWRLPSTTGELFYCLSHHFFPFGGLFSTLLSFRRFDMNSITSSRESEVLSAACLLVRKDVFTKIGYLEEEYFLFSEENDFFFRMRKAGFRAVYVPEAEVVHLVGQSRKKRSHLDSEMNFLKSRLIYFRRTDTKASGVVRSIYKFFLGWSLFFANVTYRLKGSRNPEYVELYRHLNKTLSETR